MDFDDWVQGLDAVQATVGFVTAVIVPVVALLLILSAGRVTRVQQWVLFAPVKDAARRVRRLPDTDRHHVRTVVSQLREFLARTLVEPEVPVAGFPRSLTSAAGTDVSALLRVAYLVCREAVVPGRRGVIARAFWPAQAALELERLTALELHLESVVTLIEMDVDHRISDFAIAISAYTGAVVLADGADSRSGVIDRFQVWHTGNWTGSAEPHPADASRDPHARVETAFDQRHVGRDSSSLLEAGTGQRHPMAAGDYDGRVLDLRAVRPRLDARTQGVVAVLETNECCYVESERSVLYAGKHLSADLGSDADPRTAVFLGPRVDRSRTEPSGDSRIVILATALTLVSYSNDVPTLIFARRSDRARNAHNVISATAGGVFELGRGLAPGDVDESGNADPLVGVLREATEELGIEIPASDVGAMCVFYSNILGKRRLPTDEAEGQLGASVVFLAHTHLSLDDLERERTLHADWAKGRYELDRFVPLPMPVPISRSVDDVSNAAKEFVSNLDRLSSELDQNALISALYAAAHTYGYAPTLAWLIALDKPWWAVAWDGGSPGGRLVRDPYTLSPDDAVRMSKVSSSWDSHRADLGMFSDIPPAH